MSTSAMKALTPRRSSAAAASIWQRWQTRWVMLDRGHRQGPAAAALPTPQRCSPPPPQPCSDPTALLTPLLSSEA
jgi:hypothetical protein